MNKGTWDRGYQYSYTAVVDGADGSLLWAFNSSRVGFMSGTTLRAEGYGNDAILFTTVGHLDTLPLGEVRALERVTQGKMTPHEWSPKRKGGSKRSRREAVEEGHFSVTEELEARLGLVRRQSDRSGGNDNILKDTMLPKAEGNSPPSNILSISPGGALAVKPTKQIPPVSSHDVYSSLVPSSTACFHHLSLSPDHCRTFRTTVSI